MTTSEPIPSCAASMGCLCAGHARGMPPELPCDTAETTAIMTDRDWYNIRRALVFHYNTLVKKKNRALKGKGAAGPRPSELVMELVDVMETYERVKALHPPPPKAAKAGSR